VRNAPPSRPRCRWNAPSGSGETLELPLGTKVVVRRVIGPDDEVAGVIIAKPSD
jgi:hypothetical protein